MVSRRMAVAGGAGALVLGALGYRAWDRGVFEGVSGEAYEPWVTWQGTEDEGVRRPLHAAILGASPHNTQPWLFEPRSRDITVYADRTRHLGAFDPFRREMHLGIGAAIENLVITASALRMAAAVRTVEGKLGLPPSPEAIPVATVTLMSAYATAGKIFHAIPKRHTHRGAYLPDKPVEGLNGLRGLADPERMRLVFVTDPGARKEFGALIVSATEHIVGDPEMSADSYRWIRTGRRDVEANRDGVVIDTSGVSPSTVILGKMAPDQDRETTDKYWLGMTADTHVATAPAFGMLLVRDRLDMASAIMAGRTWQRLHLTLTADGIAAQPLNQPVEMVDRDAMLGRNDTFSTALNKFAGEPGWEPTFVFRLGHAESEAQRSPRRRLEDVMKT